MRDAIERMKLERRLALLFVGIVMALAAALNLLAGRSPAPSLEAPGRQQSVGVPFR